MSQSDAAPAPSMLWLATMLAVVLSGPVFGFQDKGRPAVLGTPGDPTWHRMARLKDGRTFVTDGGLALDAAYARPRTLPSNVLAASSGKVLEDYMSAKLKDEFASSELKKDRSGRTYSAPSGLVLSATYVDYLRRLLPAASLRFRMEGEATPIVIVSKGKVVGVLMPVKRA